MLTRGDEILVIKRGPQALLPGYWAPLSGRLEEGETHEQAVVREAMEEVGVSAHNLKRVWECPSSDGQFHLDWWMAEAGPEELKLQAGEVAEARWVSPEEFLRLEPNFEGDRDFFIEILPTVLGAGGTKTTIRENVTPNP